MLVGVYCMSKILPPVMIPSVRAYVDLKTARITLIESLCAITM